MYGTDMQPPADGRLLLPSVDKHSKFGGSRHGVQHKMQLYSVRGSEQCSRQSWTVLQQLCSGGCFR